MMDDGEIVCIYDGAYADVRFAEAAVCAYSKDWLHWTKKLCIGPDQSPSYASQTQHDTQIWRDGPNGTWYLLSGGCTYNGTNDNTTAGVPCQGNGQLWNSTDLKTFTYVRPITTKGGPGPYWELPYLLPFDATGLPLDNYHHEQGSIYALLYGSGRRNEYWVGSYDNDQKIFVPNNTSEPKVADSSAYYSFNPHATDTAGPKGQTRRIMFGWVLGASSTAVIEKHVPYWQSTHSMARLLTVSGNSLVQLPAPEIQKLRTGEHWTYGPMAIENGSTYSLPGLASDTVEIIARFKITGKEPANSSFGIALRVGGGNTNAVAVGYRPSTQSMGIGTFSLDSVPTALLNWKANLVPQPSKDVVELHLFLDRSVIELFSGGAALTGRCNLAAKANASEAQGVDVWADGGAGTNLVSLDAWDIGTMWGEVL